MKVFIQGAGFGLLFSTITILFLKLSPWTVFPQSTSAVLFVLGGGLMGGLFHLLLGSMFDVGSDPN